MAQGGARRTRRTCHHVRRKGIENNPGLRRTALPEATPAINTTIEIVVLEEEDTLIDAEGDIFHVTCPTCHATVSRREYSSHRNGKGCRLPARPKENTQDELCCETCHRTFESPRANDFHEPCKAAVNYVPQRKNKRTYHTSSPMTSTVIQHDV